MAVFVGGAAKIKPYKITFRNSVGDEAGASVTIGGTAYTFSTVSDGDTVRVKAGEIITYTSPSSTNGQVNVNDVQVFSGFGTYDYTVIGDAEFRFAWEALYITEG